MTEIVTSEELYLATVIDLFSRRLLGYAMGERHDAELVVASLHMAAATRGGDVRGVIFDSDRGSEYQSDHAAAVVQPGILRQSGSRQKRTVLAESRPYCVAFSPVGPAANHLPLIP
ncbi:DDE-type integrase/transposase/recombinase [Streptomyces sp. NPDC047022]|uniref:DDE-type integrase/transposase/recombinase n=1 Tax=Streptomyces sp. NPDC047022 TaxID=3155737 RepID=UPI0033F8056E